MSFIISKIRVSFWFISGLFRKHLKVFVVSFFSSVIILLILRTIYPTISPYLIPKMERVAVIGTYTPSNLPLSIQTLISSGLTAITTEGSPSSSLAESWNTSEDGKIYTFILRKQVFWHDQTEFKSSNINYNLRDAIILPKSGYEVEVRLNNPYVPLPILLSKPLFKKGLIGVGEYKVKSLKLNGDSVEYLELVASSINIPKKIYRFYPTEETAIIAFKLGEVDTIEDITDPRELINWNSVVVSEKVLLNRFVGLFFNTQHEYFKEKEIRQSIALATPSFYGEKPLGSISPLSWAYYPKVKSYEQNLDTAQKKLADTPLASSSNTIVISTFQNLLTTANKIIEEWAKAGIHAEVKVENSIPNDFQILLATQEIPPDPDQYPLWHSVQSSTNLTKLVDPKIDKLLEDGRVSKDIDERLGIYADFQRFIAEESPVAFLYYPRLYTVKRK